MISGGVKKIASYPWEIMLFIMILAAVSLAGIASPLYLNYDQIIYSLQQSIAIVGILAIGFMILIVLGEMDISLPAILAIGTILFAKLSQSGVPLYVSLPVVILICALAGTVNGLLVVSYGLPSMAVTLGTMGAYRALALLIGGNEGYAAQAFHESYIWLGSANLFGLIPVSLCLLAFLFLLFMFIMHRTVFGRLVYAAGNNRVATRFSGYNVPSVIVSAYTLAGALASLAALVFVGQFQSARADNASGLLLFIVACVVLGGFDAAGGKGNVIGLIFSLLFIGTVQNGMGLVNTPGPVQTLIIGCILIIAVLIPVLIRESKRLLHHKEEQRVLQNLNISTEIKPSFQASKNQSGIAPRLSLRNVSKSFGGIKALKNVSFDIMPGEIHAICGENGAGKSTLVKIITGLHPADTGEVLLDGAPIKFRSPMEARKEGVLAVYQDPKLFPNLSVAENVFMGIHPRARLGTVDRKKMIQRTNEVLCNLGISLDPNAVVAGLSIAEMQFVEFARAMSEGVGRLLILDEPTASLSPGETERLFAIVRQLKAAGTSIILISHRLEELAGLVDTITVLRDGEYVTTKPEKDLSQAEIVKLMVGRSLDTLYGGSDTEVSVKKSTAEKELLRVEKLGQIGVFENVSFNVRGGEIVCLAGLVGAGRTEIAQTIFGITPPTSGGVFVEGTGITARNPRQMLSHGIAYLPEDREIEGLISKLSVLKNMVLPKLKQLSNFGVINAQKERELGEKYTAKLQIKLAGLDAPVASLSGGNRQKVVLTKWLAMNPKVLILDEPTHGIDVGAKAQVHRMIFQLASQGIGMLVISSDLPEVLRISDRILVISDGRLVAEFSREEATQEKIMMAAAIGNRNQKCDTQSA